ncbi:MAG TPA: peptide chain release factor N(5)-glutamine methyltransferase [Bacteroidia bacterium]|nr:peptide chain release factor N(5)-glutamine methyltransferase [Bacteroidia bacterium]
MKIASNKIKDIIRFFRDELKDSYEDGELESIIAYCFEHYLKLNRTELISRADETISESELLKFNFAIKELKRHKPIQYILGEADFYRLKLKVNEHVLIPRPETEELVHLIIGDNKMDSPSILDIGTGSGCIPIALKKNIPSAKISATDISEEALEVAKQNAHKNNVEINFFLEDILHPTSDIGHPTSDIIVSNPPYICLSEKSSMSKNVLDYEPHLALFVENNDPLIFYKAISDFALKSLNKNGKIYFEINQSLSSETKNLLENKGFKNVELIKDLSNNYRILRGNI